MFGILLPNQVATAQRVFKEIIKEPWFVRSHENDRDCAAIIVRAIQNGIGNEPEIAYQTKSVAKQRFSVNTPSDAP